MRKFTATPPSRSGQTFSYPSNSRVNTFSSLGERSEQPVGEGAPPVLAPKTTPTAGTYDINNERFYHTQHSKSSNNSTMPPMSKIELLMNELQPPSSNMSNGHNNHHKSSSKNSQSQMPEQLSTIQQTHHYSNSLSDETYDLDKTTAASEFQEFRKEKMPGLTERTFLIPRNSSTHSHLSSLANQHSQSNSHGLSHGLNQNSHEMHGQTPNEEHEQIAQEIQQVYYETLKKSKHSNSSIGIEGMEDYNEERDRNRSENSRGRANTDISQSTAKCLPAIPCPIRSSSKDRHQSQKSQNSNLSHSTARSPRDHSDQSLANTNSFHGYSSSGEPHNQIMTENNRIREISEKSSNHRVESSSASKIKSKHGGRVSQSGSINFDQKSGKGSVVGQTSTSHKLRRFFEHTCIKVSSNPSEEYETVTR